MSSLSTYFQGSDTRFGIFYPTNHLVAIFPTLAEAAKAEQIVHSSHFAGDNMIAVAGAEVIQYAKENFQKGGVWGALMSELSRFIGTEAVYADRDLELAHQGSAFLVVHAPTEQQKADAWALLRSLNPQVVRYYSSGGIEEFGDNKPALVPEAGNGA